MFFAVRFARTLLVWAALLAYVTPATVHGRPAQHVDAPKIAATSCSDHHNNHVAVTDRSTASVSDDNTPIDSLPTNGTYACCSAMCAPALHSSVELTSGTAEYAITVRSGAGWTVASQRPAPLDRPPKT